MPVDIPAQLVTSGEGVPRVCVRHGEDQTATRKVVFRSRTPGWVYPLVLLGVLTVVIVAAAVQKRVTARSWPLCDRCRATGRKRVLVGLGLAVLSVLMLVVLVNVVPAGSRYSAVIGVGTILLLAVGLGIASRASSAVLAVGETTRDGSAVRFDPAHPRFAEQAVAAQEWAVRPWAARQGYVPAGQPPGGAPPQPAGPHEQDAALRAQWGPEGGTRY
jgi:hypothetical protein